MQHIQDTLAGILLSKEQVNNAEELLLQTSEKQLFSVYQNNYTETLLKTLSITFSACQTLVGADYFKWLSKKYSVQYPSHSFSLEHYGHHFSNFIKPYGVQHDLYYLHEVAQLEWCMHLATHAADGLCEPVYNITALETIDACDYPLILFHLPTSTQLLKTQYAIYDIWKLAHTQQEAIQPVNLQPDGFYHMVFKDNFDIIHQPIDIKTYDFLVCLKQQNNFGKLCEILSTTYTQEQISITLSNIISTKLIQHFSILA